MYNRYIRNDHGTYTRIAEEDGPPVPPSGGEPIHREEPSHGDNPFRGEDPFHGDKPFRGEDLYHGEEPPRGAEPLSGKAANSGEDGTSRKPPHSPPQRRRGGPGGLFRRLLDDARMDRIDDGDLLLLGLLFFLAREGADEELLTALGLLLIL